MKKISLKIEGMHCGSCVMNIEGELDDTAGVKKSKVNYASQIAEVEFDEEKIDEGKIKEIIQDLGYSAK